ncbi:MAG: TorD/DmsD family molecular chaperone [Bacillota bacterium]
MVDTLIEDSVLHEAMYLAEERRNLYGLLALLFGKEPSSELLKNLREPGLLQALEEIEPGICNELTEIPGEELLQDMVVEYTRLFLGPGKHISPHESVYVSGFGSKGGGSKGLLWGEATVQVQEKIKEYGLSLDGAHHRIPDHIAVELELMYHLTGKEMKAWASGEAAEAREYQKQQTIFLEEHLGRWAGQFCSLIDERSGLRFYRGIAGITRQFILSETEYLSVTHNRGC